MKLIGRYLSPYTRRVGISLKVLGLNFEHLPLSNVENPDEIRKYNPMVRVPALVCDDGTVLVESGAILDYIDELVAHDRRLVPPAGEARRNVLQLVGWATGACEKMVVTHYELHRRPEEKIYREYVDKNLEQITTALRVLDEVAKATGGWLGGDRITQADISAVSTYEFGKRVLPELQKSGAFPGLDALCARADAAHPAFADTRG